MKHEGYTITKITEKTWNREKEEVPVVSYQVSIDDKVVSVGLPSVEMAKAAIDKRSKIRARMGLNPVG